MTIARVLEKIIFSLRNCRESKSYEGKKSLSIQSYLPADLTTLHFFLGFHCRHLILLGVSKKRNTDFKKEKKIVELMSDRHASNNAALVPPALSPPRDEGEELTSSAPAAHRQPTSSLSSSTASVAADPHGKDGSTNSQSSMNVSGHPMPSDLHSGSEPQCDVSASPEEVKDVEISSLPDAPQVNGGRQIPLRAELVRSAKESPSSSAQSGRNRESATPQTQSRVNTARMDSPPTADHTAGANEALSEDRHSARRSASCGSTAPTSRQSPRPLENATVGPSRSFYPSIVISNDHYDGASQMGINFSGYSSSQRALVVPSTSRDDTSFPVYRNDRATSEQGYSPTSHAEIRAMLITSERELAEQREEVAKRGMKVEALEAALKRERTNARVLRDRYNEEAAAAREEHETQTRQLREQLHVRMLVAEGAMVQQSKMLEDAVRRKKELLHLLDREREEKSYIMSDYREQTESLIAEQGREITTLRSTLDKLKEEFDDLFKQHQSSMEDRESQVEKLRETLSQLDRERVESTSRFREVQKNAQSEKDYLREQLQSTESELQRANSQHTKRCEELADQLQRSEEYNRVKTEEHQHAMEALKVAYLRDLDSLRQELKSLKESRDRLEVERQHDQEKAAKREEKTVESLRQALEQSRLEKEAAVDDGYQQREILQRQHRDKIAAMQRELDTISTELSEERSARKEAASEAEVLRVRAENFDKTNQRLSTELEAAQVDQRTRERATEQAHQISMEELRGKLRTATTNLSYAQQQVSQQTIEQQQLRDELAKKSNAMESMRESIKRMESNLNDELTKAKEAATVAEQAHGKVLAQLRSENKQYEAECERLDRSVRDAEARFYGLTKQIEAERRALEETSRHLQEAKAQIEDARVTLTQEKGRAEMTLIEKRQLESQLEELKLYKAELENSLHMAERRMAENQLDQSRQSKVHEGKLEELSQLHKAELAAVRMSAEQARSEAAKIREALMIKDAELQRGREEAGQLHREAALRESGLQEAMEDLRENHETEMQRMDGLLNGLRSDLARSQAMCTQYQRELSHFHRNAEGQQCDLEVALDQAEAARVKLLEDAKYRDQLNQELQGTVRLISSRLSANEDEQRRLQEELADTNKKMQDVHTLLGRKDATIGQLHAKIRAYESRGGGLL